MAYYEKIYYGLSFIIVVLYVLAFIGLYQTKYLVDLKFYFRLLVGLMLVYTFNPYIKKSKRIKEIDRRVAFSGGLAILAMMGLSSITAHLKIHIIPLFSRFVS